MCHFTPPKLSYRVYFQYLQRRSHFFRCTTPTLEKKPETESVMFYPIRSSSSILQKLREMHYKKSKNER